MRALTIPRQTLVVLLVASAALALLQLSGLAFWQGLAINFAIFVILVQALNLASGFTGVFSLGHIGFMAIGAYTSAILTLPLARKAEYLPNLPDWLAGVHLDMSVGPWWWPVSSAPCSCACPGTLSPWLRSAFW